MTTRINLLQPEIRQDPYPTYALMRRQAPIQQIDPGGLWAVCRYEDLQFIYRHPELFSSEGLRALRTPSWLPRNPLADSILVKDGAAHDKLRALVGRAFSPASIACLKPRICAIAADLAQRMEALDQVDFADAFAAQLPGRVIAEIFGLPPARYQDLKRWANAVVIGSGGQLPPQAVMTSVRQSLAEMESYLRDIITARRQSPDDDMVSHLVRATIDGQTLTDDEIVSFLFLLLPAGVETTAHALSNAMVAFTERPQDFDDLRANPALIPSFVNELLRHTPPVQATLRMVMADAEVGGVKLPKGSVLMLLIGAANRDEIRYPDPDRFDARRDSQGGLAFGHGAHYCMGAALGKLELAAGLEALAARFRGFERLSDVLAWNTALSVRGLTTLPIRCIPM